MKVLIVLDNNLIIREWLEWKPVNYLLPCSASIRLLVGPFHASCYRHIEANRSMNFDQDAFGTMLIHTFIQG